MKERSDVERKQESGVMGRGGKGGRGERSKVHTD